MLELDKVTLIDTYSLTEVVLNSLSISAFF